MAAPFTGPVATFHIPRRNLLDTRRPNGREQEKLADAKVE